MTDGGDGGPRQRLHELDRATWCLAAVAAAGRRDAALAGDAAAVLELLGISLPGDALELDALVAAATAPLLQAGRVVAGGSAWEEQDDEALLAQGRSSAGIGPFFTAGILAQLPGAEDLHQRPARMLDVGVGVAAMAVALCQHLPHLTIVGLDVFPRALQLARRTVDEAGLADRIVLRHLDVTELDDADGFDLAWLPAPFLPRPALEAGLRRVARNLRPGGWVLLGHGRLDGDPLDVAVTRFKTAAYGGTALTERDAAALLTDAGLTDARTLETPPEAPRFTAARAAPPSP